MTDHPQLFELLANPFEPHEVKQRSAPGGKQLHYVTARTVMNRLDSVLGPENWWDAYDPQENSVICRLSVRLPDGQVVTKSDAGGYAGMADQGDDDKSGYSDAFKRTAAKFGVGRYLYRDGVPSFASNGGSSHAAEHAASPTAPVERPAPVAPPPSPAQPRPPAARTAPVQNGAQPSQAQPSGQYGPPRSGKALFAWVKEMEQQHEISLLKYLNGWAKLQEFPGRMVDWGDAEVSAGYHEGCRKIQSMSTAGAEEQAGGKAPSGAATGGAVQPMTAATETAIHFTLNAQRHRLLNLVWELARARKRSDDVKDEDFHAATAVLDGLRTDGRIITPSISACQDGPLLAEYIEAAETQLSLCA